MNIWSFTKVAAAYVCTVHQFFYASNLHVLVLRSKTVMFAFLQYLIATLMQLIMALNNKNCTASKPNLPTSLIHPQSDLWSCRQQHISLSLFMSFTSHAYSLALLKESRRLKPWKIILYRNLRKLLARLSVLKQIVLTVMMESMPCSCNFATAHWACLPTTTTSAGFWRLVNKSLRLVGCSSPTSVLSSNNKHTPCWSFCTSHISCTICAFSWLQLSISSSLADAIFTYTIGCVLSSVYFMFIFYFCIEMKGLLIS
jgi:hypothetical protein